jgi:MoaA/NifB/PqqE/SkfB family radical SAM enzyme
MTLVLEMTTRCNLRCKHCLRDWERPPTDLSRPLLEKILEQAWRIGFRSVSLTGGEVTLHPDFADIVRMVCARGFKFAWMCNGTIFPKFVPLLLEPGVARNHRGVCFSLDGPDEQTHDAIRGPGSFKKIITSAGLCALKRIPFSFKMILNRINMDRAWETVRLAGSLGAASMGMAVPSPSPKLFKEDLMPTVEEYRELPEIIASYGRATRGFVHVEGNTFTRNRLRGVYCFAMRGEGYNITPDGRLSFCCNLSGVDLSCNQDLDKDIVADLNEVPLATALGKHAQAVADYVKRIMALYEEEAMTEFDFYPCLRCHRVFGKLDWLARDYGEWTNFFKATAQQSMVRCTQGAR